MTQHWKMCLKWLVSPWLHMSEDCPCVHQGMQQRQVSETWINTYNPDILRVWRANIDTQFILDPYACVMYIASYMLKSERSMGELLKQVSKESNVLEIRAQLRRLGS